MTTTRHGSVLVGHSLVAGRALAGTTTTRAIDPATGEHLEPPYTLLDPTQLTEATAAAAAAFPQFVDLEPGRHAALLATIAANIEAVADAIVDRAMLETGLPRQRLGGELARTTSQLRLFAEVVRQGDHRGVRIDTAQPQRSPQPRPDIRQRKVGLGPVAVFGAGNFPLAFSTAGGDTASALAAGCPVVFKAHNSHPGTSEIVGRAVTDAVAACGLPPGVFSVVYGEGTAIGQALVADPAIAAVAFTGSRAGGLAIMATAAARPVPIPVYAEMSAVNPVIVLPGALDGDLSALAAGYVASMTGSSGQLCTAPGLVLVPVGATGDRFLAEVALALAGQSGQTMLSPTIATAWQEGVRRWDAVAGVEALARGTSGVTQNAPEPVVFGTDTTTLLANEVLREEIFGAASLVVQYADDADLRQAVEAVEGQLTFTLRCSASDHDAVAALVPLLERKAGRIVVNGWPTGVEVSDAMVHGGPFPATSDSRTTSVGTAAIDRFLRPVAYQGFDDALLPAPVRQSNPWNLTRRIDGRVHLASDTGSRE